MNSIAPVHLVLGDDEFLAERAVASIVRAVREASPEGENLSVSKLRAGEVTEFEIINLLSPSLFGEDRVVVLNKADEAGKDAMEQVMKAAVNPVPGIYLVIVHKGGGRTKSQAEKLKKIAQVHLVDKIKPRDRAGWVVQEFRSHGVRPTPDVVTALLEGVGSDLRELAIAISQLVADTEGEVSAAAVRAYYQGVAEVSGFDIADLACAGQTQRALASTRRALQLGVSEVALATALQMKVAAIARLYSQRGVNEQQLAGRIGMHPFVLKKTVPVARRWSGSAVSQAVIIVAELEAAVKGQTGGQPGFAIEDAVRRIGQLAS